MRIIFQIAKNEVRNLFYSPIAWFLSIVLMVLCAFFFTELTTFSAKHMHLLNKNNPNVSLWFFDSFTKGLYLELNMGFLTSILPHIYLFVPLLTMGIIGREFSSGTFRLLYSSPVKLHKIVLGKFLGIAIYNFLLVMVVGIFMIAGFSTIRSLDVPPLICAALGIYLFLNAMSAIGFFMSSLTTYQVVSAIASFTTLFILMRIGTLWQEYDFVRDLTYFLSMIGRLEKFIQGLLTTKDVLYYLTIMAMFIGFTFLKLRSGQESSPWYVKTGRYLAIIIGGLVFGYFSSRPQLTGYLDTTATNTNTVHHRTQELLKRLDEGSLEVTLYTNIFANNVMIGLPKNRNIYLSQVWEGYQRFKPDMEFKYEYYYYIGQDKNYLYRNSPGKSMLQIAGMQAKSFQVDSALFKSPEVFNKRFDLESEMFAFMELKYKGRTAIVRTFLDGGPWPDQQNMNAAFSRLLQDDMPKVYFVAGELERNIYKEGERDYFNHVLGKGNRHSLLNLGFDTDTLNLTTHDIPASTTLLVMADPKKDLSPAVMKKLQTYIDNGGNMLLLGEPGKQQVLNPLLSQTGVQFHNGQLVELSKNETPDKITNYYTLDGLGLAEQTALVRHKYVWEHGHKEDSMKNGFAGAAAITWSDSSFTIKPVFMSSPGKSWIKMGKLVADSAAPVFSPAEGDVLENSYSTAIELSRQRNNKEQRIIIAGDADFLSNVREREGKMVPLYAWLSYNKHPVYTPYPRVKDNDFILSPAGATVQRILFVWVLPAVLLVTGTVLLIRRKRK